MQRLISVVGQGEAKDSFLRVVWNPGEPREEEMVSSGAPSMNVAGRFSKMVQAQARHMQHARCMINLLVFINYFAAILIFRPWFGVHLLKKFTFGNTITMRS